jgi:chromate reductase, NAD(P)H dehydrogenase (quinone)
MLILAASSGENLAMARQIAATAEVDGVNAEIIELCRLDLPLYNPTAPDLDPGPGLERLVDALQRHRALFVCAPEYNGSIPPVLSNAIAWLSVRSADFRALFQQRPVALGSHSGGGGHRVLVAMRQQFAYLGCTVLGRELLATGQKPLNPQSLIELVGQLSQLDRLGAAG